MRPPPGVFFLLLLLFIAFIEHYSLLSGRLTAHMLYMILNMRLYPIFSVFILFFIARIINIHRSGVLITLFGCCMAGTT